MTSTQHADLKPTLAALVDKHAERLNAALAAIAGRGYWSAYPESPSPRVYGEGTAEAGRAAFEFHGAFVTYVILPNFDIVNPLVYLAELGFAIALTLGLFVHLARLAAALFTVTLWLGIYNQCPGDPAE